MPVHSQLLNRLMFVTVNALLLYLVASRYTKTIRTSVAAHEEALVRARGYFESSVEGIIFIDGGGSFRQWNPRAQELFGYREDGTGWSADRSLTAATISLSPPRASRGLLFGPESRLMGRGTEIAGRRKDGTESPVESV